MSDNNTPNQPPHSVTISDEKYSIYHRLKVHPTHNRYQYVLKNKNGSLSRICWAPEKAEYLPFGKTLKVYTSGEHLEFHF
jgi:hypothetical protein